MKKMALMAVVLGLAGCDGINPTLVFDESEWVYGGQTMVMGRTWQITREAKNLSSVRAVRDNNNLNPFGGPAVRKSIQASRAIEQATGCKIVNGSLHKDVSDVYAANVICKYRSEG